MGSTINLISRIRDVHGLGQIGFGLNTHPIRTDRVEPPSTIADLEDDRIG